MRRERLEPSRVRRRAVPVRSKCVACVLENHGQSLKATPRTLSAPLPVVPEDPIEGSDGRSKRYNTIKASSCCTLLRLGNCFLTFCLPARQFCPLLRWPSLQSYTLHDTYRIHHWLYGCYRPIQRQGAPNLLFRIKRIDRPTGPLAPRSPEADADPEAWLQRQLCGCQIQPRDL